MEILKIIGTFFIQPTVWLATILMFVIYNQRVKKERQAFRTAVDSDFYEGRHAIKVGTLFGIIGSVILFGTGTMIPMNWVLIYTICMIVGLLLYPLFNSIYPLFLISGLIYGMLEWQPSNMNVFKNETFQPEFLTGILMVGTLSLLITGIALHLFRKSQLSPSTQAGKRGRNISSFKMKELYLIPLVILVPGNQFHSVFDWWPLIHVAGTEYNVIILPLIIGLTLRIYKELPKLAISFTKKQYLYLAVISACLTVISAFSPIAGIIGLVILLIAYFGDRYVIKRHDNKQEKWFAESDEGILIVGVRPETPAAKMDVEVGDVVIQCNGINVRNENELYKALESSSTYCRLKIKTFSGDTKITESAIFSDSPYEIGLVIIK
ncbi:PDZ domain-containing protein [Dellaglioa carnosa]|uniref:PDZ domain-containing protein n=1 Tax=Dellaglioa carnosa TaxID=2995136 RepID=A0ABT4JMX9_9LACO|nr:PDZ domain-containing protein [Dellaglioa carnosa]MCZ2491717.1 PDZ domain-containing protein [Dellaglioa carnosa]MCZ2494883.1 PDZ domain-containing protein [Dellaglioa carnosa]MDK1731746.1 PDZ domain-containing protein [Dellaglioa carnosa]